MRTPRTRRLGRLALATTLAGSLAVPAVAHADDWATIDADAQGSRNGTALGPVDPQVDWVWDDDQYIADGEIGGTRTAIPGVLDADGRLLFKSRNTAFDEHDAGTRYDLLALDPTDGSAEVVLPDANDDYCAPAVGHDGAIWSFQDRNDRTKSDGFADHSAAAVVRMEDGAVTHRYSGPGGDVAGVFGCSDGLQVAPDGTVVFRDHPTPGGVLDGSFTPWLRAFDQDGGLRWEQFYDPDDTGVNINQPWVRVAPAGTPAEGTAYAFARTDGTPAVVAIDLATGAIARTLDLPGTGYVTAPAIDPDGGILFSLEQGNIGNDGHVLRVEDDGETLAVDWHDEITYDRDRDGALMALPRSLQVHGETVVAMSDTGKDIERFRWADGAYVGRAPVGSITNGDSDLAIDGAGNAYVARLSGSGADDALLDVIGPAGGRVQRLLQGAVADANDGEIQGARTVGPIADDGALYLWGGDNNWVRLSGRDATRVAGETRYATAAEVATANFPRGVDTVFLATGTNFPDALTAGPLAAHLQAPVLLTDPAVLPAETAAALDDLDPANVVALGGTLAVSDEVLADAVDAANGATPDRIAGVSRYDTAAKVAERLPDTDTVYLAVGTNYPDTLAGGPATDGAPILLTGTDALPQETVDALAARGPSRVIALGGPVAISQQVLEAAADAAGGADTDRLSGETRYGTGVAIAQTVVTDPSFTGTVYVAVGTNYPDAVSAASAAKAEGAPIVLTESEQLPDEVATWLSGVEPLERIVVLGGTTAVSDDVAADLAALVD